VHRECGSVGFLWRDALNEPSAVAATPCLHYGCLNVGGREGDFGLPCASKLPAISGALNHKRNMQLLLYKGGDLG
jgi:hypothetical protein